MHSALLAKEVRDSGSAPLPPWPVGCKLQNRPAVPRRIWWNGAARAKGEGELPIPGLSHLQWESRLASAFFRGKYFLNFPQPTLPKAFPASAKRSASSSVPPPPCGVGAPLDRFGLHKTAPRHDLASLYGGGYRNLINTVNNCCI